MGTTHSREAKHSRKRIALVVAAVAGAVWLFLAPSPVFGLGPALSASPKAASRGASITINGTDHPQPCDVDNATDLRIVWDNNLVVSEPINVNPDGSFKVVVAVPLKASLGPHQLTSHCTARPPNASPFQAALATTSVEVVEPTSKPSGDPRAPQPPIETRVLPGRIKRAAPPGDDFVVRPRAPVPPPQTAVETVTSDDIADAGLAAEPTVDAGRSPLPISLNSPSESFKDLATLVKSIAVTGFMLVLLGFPSELFNSALESNYEEVIGWFRRPRSGLNRLTRSMQRFPKNATFAIFAALGGIIYAFLDPTLGFNRRSFALTVGLMISVAVVTLAVELPIMLYAKRLGAGGYLSAFPQALILGIGCVLASRWLTFRPGYVYGITYGYKPVNCEPSDRRIGKATAVGAVILLAISLATWVVWAPVDVAASRPGASLGLLILDSTLAGIVIAGIQGLVFGLLPLRFCDGSKVAAWSRWGWLALYALSTLAFVQIILSPKGGFLTSSGGSMFKVLGLFVGFGLFSVAFWAYFRFRSRPAATAPAADDSSVADLGLSRAPLEKVRSD